MSDRDAEQARALLAVHEQAEAAVEEALALTAYASSRVERFDMRFDSDFEYVEATRTLRAALTALRSAAIDLHAIGGQSDAGGRSGSAHGDSGNPDSPRE